MTWRPLCTLSFHGWPPLPLKLEQDGHTGTKSVRELQSVNLRCCGLSSRDGVKADVVIDGKRIIRLPNLMRLFDVHANGAQGALTPKGFRDETNY